MTLDTETDTAIVDIHPPDMQSLSIDPRTETANVIGTAIDEDDPSFIQRHIDRILCKHATYTLNSTIKPSMTCFTTLRVDYQTAISKTEASRHFLNIITDSMFV